MKQGSTGIDNTDFSNDIWLASGQVVANLAESVAVEARKERRYNNHAQVEHAGMQRVLSGLDQINVILSPELPGGRVR